MRGEKMKKPLFTYFKNHKDYNSKILCIGFYCKI